MILITKDTYPAIHAAMLEIKLDNGAHHVNRICGPGTVDLDTFKAPEARFDQLPVIDEALAELRKASEEMWTTFLCGDHDEAEEMCQGNDNLMLAHRFLDDWFNDFEEPHP